MTTPPGGTAGLLDEIESFLQREWQGTLHDGYYIVTFRAPAEARYRAAEGETLFDQVPGRTAIFELAFRDSKRLWLVALGDDPGSYVRGPQRADQHTGWTQPDWLGPVYHTLYAFEAAPRAFDIGTMVEVAITGLHSFTFIDPDRRLGFEPGDVSSPARLVASWRDDLNPIVANGPQGDWVLSGRTGGPSGLLDEVQQFLARDWPCAVFDDGYHVVRVSAPAEVSYWAPGDRHGDQQPARRQLFDLMFRESARLWLVTLDHHAGPHVSRTDRVDCRTLWATPEYQPREHSVCAIEAATGAFDAGAIIEMAALGGADGATFIDPQRKTGFQPGSSSYPARLFACTRADLDPVIAQLPAGDWF